MSADNAPSDDGGNEPRISVDDPDDYNLSRRYQQIQRAREHVIRVRRESGREVAAKTMNLGRFREELAQAVADFAIELEWIAQDDEKMGEIHTKIWDEVEIDAPRHPDGKITGIGEFVDHYGTIPVEEEVEYETPFGTTRGTEEQLDAPSIETTIRIYRQCNHFMQEIGLDVRTKGITPGPEANPVDPAGRFNE